MRYFLTFAYLGTKYSGWQVQPNAPSVQATLEAALATVLQQKIEVTGCGRTDTGVHARYYVAHFDAKDDLSPQFLNGLNSVLPADIAAHDIRPVAPDAHARYDAFERSYEYHIAFRKDPFAKGMVCFLPQHKHLDLKKIQDVADLLLRYKSFSPFCKTDSGLENFDCELKRAFWEHRPHDFRLVFHITANRFLRGMVRLIVGACLNAGLGKIEIEDVKSALDEQKQLKKSLSVPPQGLFLTEVKYPPAIFAP